MQKQAPSVGRILIAVGFTLSCFGLMLFLWIAFGGPIPLKPEAYKISAYFPETTTLARESDVRIGGVSVGKVKAIELAPPEYRVAGNDTTEATLEIRPEFAPIAEDTKAILRQKTLLGETYIELTPGTEPGGEEVPVSIGAAANVSDAEAENVKTLEEGETLGIEQTQDATQIDEIFNALDEDTRESFQRWLASSADAIEGRGLDLNDAFGNLGPFVEDAASVLEILNRQKAELQGLVRDTGTVFEALTERDQALAGVITGSNETFEALASRGPGPRRVVPDPAHLRARVAPHIRPAGRVPGRHQAADPAADPDRQRPLADARLGAPSLAQPKEPLRGSRRADHRVQDGPPGARAHAERAGARAGGA